jgi:hypothetical protein
VPSQPRSTHLLCIVGECRRCAHELDARFDCTLSGCDVCDERVWHTFEHTQIMPAHAAEADNAHSQRTHRTRACMRSRGNNDQV